MRQNNELSNNRLPLHNNAEPHWRNDNSQTHTRICIKNLLKWFGYIWNSVCVCVCSTVYLIFIPGPAPVRGSASTQNGADSRVPGLRPSAQYKQQILNEKVPVCVFAQEYGRIVNYSRTQWRKTWMLCALCVYRMVQK